MDRREWTAFVRSELWAILPQALEALTALTAGTITASAERQRAGSIALLPLYGPISHRDSLLTMLFGGTSTERFSAAFRQVMADDSVAAIVLDVDSPGGTVNGVTELADELFAARGVKPILAVATGMAASAAYWLASQADEIVISPSAEVGSIGAFAVHEDVSRAADAAGVKMTLIAAGKYKDEGWPFEPLSDDARAAIQARVDDYYGQFVGAVARGRGVTAADVRTGFGEGRMVGAREAVRLGMADRVATLADTLRRLGNPRVRGQIGRGRADDDGPAIEAGLISAPTDALAGHDVDWRRRRLRLRGAALDNRSVPL